MSISVALGNAEDPSQPLLKARLEGPVADVAAAEALGQQAAGRLRELGAARYLPGVG
jgi:hydroxymethylbilane synthase